VRLAARFLAGDGVPENLDGALALLRRACELGRGEGCAMLARMFDAGGAAGPDAARARRWRERACALRDGGACTVLGTVAWRAGDFAAARAQLDVACAVEHAAGCFGLAVLYARGDGVPRDAGRAAALHQQACELGHARACLMLAERHERGLGVARDAARAAFWRQRACALDPGTCPAPAEGD
jgi:TPR repeat protein